MRHLCRTIQWSCFVIVLINELCYGFDKKIVGGEIASIYNVSYQASMQMNKQHFCGGAIISNQHILTAAHCFEGWSANKLMKLVISVGSTYVTAGTKYQVNSVMVHEKFKDSTLLNDLALVKLKQPLVFNNNVQPIALPYQNEKLFTNTPAVVSGWGVTEFEGELSKILLKATVLISDSKTCAAAYGRARNEWFCAGYKEGGVDACQGDSGGPLVAQGKLIGIVSFGFDCARPGYPGVYTRVSTYVNWIQKQMAEEKSSSFFKTILNWFKS